MNIRTLFFAGFTLIVGCGGEMVEWDICHGAAAPDDAENYYYEFGDSAICFDNTSVDRATCESWGGTWEVIYESEGSVVDSAVLDPLAEAACADNGYAVPCPDADGFSKAWVQDAADCPAAAEE